MNLILSSKAAERLQQEVQSREDFIADINTWRIDVLDLRKRGIFLITQEKSLYTLISSYKQGIKGIIAQIGMRAIPLKFIISNPRIGVW
jgi:hypothetical protein